MARLLQSDANPDLAYHFDADPDPAYHFDADPDPDPTFQFDADPCGYGSTTLENTLLHSENEDDFAKIKKDIKLALNDSWHPTILVHLIIHYKSSPLCPLTSPHFQFRDTVQCIPHIVIDSSEKQPQHYFHFVLILFLTCTGGRYLPYTSVNWEPIAN